MHTGNRDIPCSSVFIRSFVRDVHVRQQPANADRSRQTTSLAANAMPPCLRHPEFRKESHRTLTWLVIPGFLHGVASFLFASRQMM